ncbi:MAG: hypothetical protein K0R73_35 [Candidatus Midichloriaceae bacterium]|jgi:hypothetical protein|nr:hypothetical protein [Candidatus Midichloriaceae bacterium]
MSFYIKDVLHSALNDGKEAALKMVPDVTHAPNNALLEEFFAKMDKGELDITMLFNALNADLVLDNNYITIPKNFAEANFDGISLKKATIVSYHNTKLNLDGCDLSYCDLAGRHYDINHVSLNGAKLDHTMGYITPDLYKSLSAQAKEESNFITASKENYFYQAKFAMQYGVESNGESIPPFICHGLAREYVRKQISWQQKGVEKNFFAELRSKLEEISQIEKSERLNHFYKDTFLQRLKEYTHYTPNTANNKKHFKLTFNLSDDGETPAPFEFFDSLPKKLQDADFLYILLGDHAAVVKVVRDNNQGVIGYNLYDTSYGESVLLDKDELSKAMLMTCSNWCSSDNFIYVSDLGKQVKKHNLVSGSDYYSKDSKNTFKLLKAIKEHDAEKIAELSKCMKIDWHGIEIGNDDFRKLYSSHQGMHNEPYPFNNLKNYFYIYNILHDGIIHANNQELIALISNNNLLDFSKSKHLLCTVNKFIMCDHFKPEVLHAFASNPTITWGEGVKELFDKFLDIAENNKFKIEFDGAKEIITATEEERNILEKLADNFKTHEDFNDFKAHQEPFKKNYGSFHPEANLYAQDNDVLVAEFFVEQVMQS